MQPIVLCRDNGSQTWFAQPPLPLQGHSQVQVCKGEISVGAARYLCVLLVLSLEGRALCVQAGTRLFSSIRGCEMPPTAGSGACRHACPALHPHGDVLGVSEGMQPWIAVGDCPKAGRGSSAQDPLQRAGDADNRARPSVRLSPSGMSLRTTRTLRRGRLASAVLLQWSTAMTKWLYVTTARLSDKAALPLSTIQGLQRPLLSKTAPAAHGR